MPSRGFVLISRGAVEACQCEAELAGVIGHELSHVVLKHGEEVLRKSKVFQTQLAGLGKLLGAATGNRGNQIFNKLVDLFDKSVGAVRGLVDACKRLQKKKAGK